MRHQLHFFVRRTARQLLFIISAVISLAVLSSCSSQDISGFKEARPRLSLEEFFEGRSAAYGVFEDRFGKLRRQFRVDITGKIAQGSLILDEKFLYDDGEASQRIWTITREPSSEPGVVYYTGRADDVTGTAKGIAAGNLLSWSYDIQLDMGGTELEVRFDDVIYQMTDELAINRATLSKWGVEIGTVTIVFLRGALAEVSGPPNLDKWQ